MAVNLIAYAVPAFIGAMVVEAAVAAVRKRPLYGINDTFANLANGIGSQLTGLFIALLTFVTYEFVAERFALTQLSGWTAWVVALVGVDFAYYWYHRLSHEVNFLWATHIVHHQSEEYNYSVALRQPWLGGMTSWAFYLPLAVLGVPLEVFLASYSLNLLYQFVVHTQLVGHVPGISWVLNMPAHHRVHHGSNEPYLDKNYAGILIIWDRMFGTFVDETIPVEYGLVKPLRSWDPVWANVHYWVELWRASRALRGWDRLRVWVKNPGWMPGDLSRTEAIVRARGRVYQKFEGGARGLVVAYLFVQFLAVTAGTVMVMVYGRSLPTGALIAIYVAALSSMALWAGLLEGRRWAVRAEGGRMLVLVLLVGVFFAMQVVG